MENKEKIWKSVTYPGVRPNTYIVSEDGEVRNVLTNHIYKPSPDKDGYFKYNLLSTHTGHSKKCFAHRLVAYQFVDNPNNNPVVDHLDGVKTHNHYTNLEWVTIKENTNRADAMGLRNVRGEANATSVYKEDFVRQICQMFEDGKSIKEVFQFFKGDIHRDQDRAFYKFLYSIKTKTAWPGVVCDYNYDTKQIRESWKSPTPQSSNYVYSEEMIREICSMLESNNSVMDIVEHFTGIRSATTPNYNKRLYGLVDGIRTGRNWTNISNEYNINPSACMNRVPLDQDSDYELLSVKIADRLDHGYTRKEIFKEFGDGTDARKSRKIRKIIENYTAMKQLSPNTKIYIDD